MIHRFWAAWRLIPRRPRVDLVLSTPLVVLAAGLEALAAAAVFVLISLMSDPAAVAQGRLGGRMVGWLGLADRPRATMLTVVAFVGVVYLVKNVIVAGSVWMQSKAWAEATTALAARVFRAYLLAPWTFHLQRNSAELVTRTLDESDAVFRFVVTPTLAILTEGLVALGIMAVLLLKSPMVTLAVLAGSLGLLLLLVRATRAVLTRWGEGVYRERIAARTALQQTLGGIKEVRLGGYEPFFFERFSGHHRRLARLEHRYVSFSTLSRLLIETTFVGAILVVVILVAGRDASAGTAVPVLGLYAYAGFRIIPSFNRILMHVTSVRFGLPTLLRVEAELEECERAAVSADGAAAPRVRFARSLELVGVGYRYATAPDPALRDVTMSIHPGESVGIVGPTGSGKSTLVNLVLGLLRPTSGRILVDDVDQATCLQGWQRLIGYVPQGVYLIDDTLRRNVAFGLPDAAIDDAQVWSALAMAQLDGFVQGLPERLETVVGERGVRLSGGEQQRVAIARALYHDPELLVFDEATSALDSGTEREISRAIEALRGRKTLLIVAHRLSTVRVCDRLVYLREGRVVDCGTFDDLVARNESFRGLVAAGLGADPHHPRS